MKLSALVLLALLGLASAVDLEWVTWTGSLPSGAVSIYNSYAERTDYVCQSECNAGFYNADLGSHCHYPWGNKELKGKQFKILANAGNLNLEWKAGSYGSVPPNSVETCPPATSGYVGRNKYGLGKVTRQSVFFIPFEGKEYWYNSYEVLTIA